MHHFHLQMKNQRHREQFAQSHSASKGQRKDLNPGISAQVLNLQSYGVKCWSLATTVLEGRKPVS